LIALRVAVSLAVTLKKLKNRTVSEIANEARLTTF